MERRKGRGRISGIELLPPECDDVIAWAGNELQKRKLPQVAIYQKFSRKLEQIQTSQDGQLEFAIPSFSAFNRHSIQLAVLTRRLNETMAIASAIADKHDAKSSDDLTLIAAEAIKTLVFEVVTHSGPGKIEPKETMQLANALRAATQAQGVSTVRRQRVDKEFSKQVGDAIEVAKAKGLSAETAEQIKAMILGVVLPKADGAP